MGVCGASARTGAETAPLYVRRSLQLEMSKCNGSSTSLWLRQTSILDLGPTEGASALAECVKASLTGEPTSSKRK